MTDDVGRSITYSASPNKAVNDTHLASVAVAVHRDTALTDDVDRKAACAAMPAYSNSELTRSLCKLIGVVHRDVNCSSSSESDCIHLHNPECSSDSAGTVVNAPLNVSSALTPLSSLAQPHSASEQVRHSVPDSRQQGEYPPRVVTRVQRRPEP